MNTAALRCRIVQMEVTPGAPVRNTERMLAALADAQRDGVQFLFFPEMAIPGYLLGDLWEQEAFVRECVACGEEVRAAAGKVVTVFGNVGVDAERRNEDGRLRKYNAAFVAADDTFHGPAGGPYPFVIKTLLPNYREFDDSRHFTGLRQVAFERQADARTLVRPVHVRGLAIGCTLCEDAWDADYAVAPLDLLARQPLDLVVNLSCSPFTKDKNHKRNRVFTQRAAGLSCPLLYVNNVGIQDNGKTVFTFDGSSTVYGPAGDAHALPAFTETAFTFDVEPGRPFRIGTPLAPRADGTAELADALLYGTAGFMRRCGVERVVVGISGGIDSAVVAALYARLLRPEHLLLVNMPGPYTSPTTRALADQLAQALGCLYARVPIGASPELTRQQLHGLRAVSADQRHAHTLDLTPFVMENVQARDRSARVLAAVAAAFGGVFTCNANKAEATVGYTTLYGDLGGYLANLADLWKGEVYDLARHLNDNVYGRPVIPPGSLSVTPSAELSPEQNVDENKGDPLVYPYHDRLFCSWVERWNRATPEDVLRWYRDGNLATHIGYEGDLNALFPTPRAFVADLERWWRQYQGMGVAKRIQAPPILAVKRRAFGFDHREAQVGPQFTRPYLAMKRDLLGE